MEYVKSDAGTLAMQETIGFFVLCLGLGPFFPLRKGIEGYVWTDYGHCVVLMAAAAAAAAADILVKKPFYLTSSPVGLLGACIATCQSQR